MRRHKIWKHEQIGRWHLTLQVSAKSRFIVHLKYPGEPSWTRSEFFSQLSLAEAKFYEWSRETTVKVAAAALGVTQ